ncbi:MULTISPECIES: hypothetical protein [Pantoea]|nr:MULTISPECIES: hypothetical protein [Pantoea]MCS3401430.1 hypothetical protein [Pantoea sp. B566]PVY84063.1 hypothetical protein C7427_105277 [Pantoea ananatis]
MSAALIVIVLVCGYLYINSHIPSKHKFKKSTGWQSYFQVALKGSYYVFISFIILFVTWVLLLATMWLLNTPLLFTDKYKAFTYAYDILNVKFVGLSLPFVLLVATTALLSFAESKNEEKKLRNNDERLRLYKEIANANPIEAILLESMTSNQNLMVSISMKSRKVYIGIVHEARLEDHDTDTIVIIPFLSGYRDKDTLSFVEEVNYAEHYSDCGITYDSSPLSLSQYRHVIPRDQIESVSLFNSDMYTRFKRKKKYYRASFIRHKLKDL